MSEVNVSASPQQLPVQSTQKARKRRPLRIALFGFGTVGSSVARILVESQPRGLELTHVFNRGVERKRVDWVPESVAWSEDADAVLASDVDVRFLADPSGGTRVELEHRNFERMGSPDGEIMRKGVDNGWPGILDLFAAEAAR